MAKNEENDYTDTQVLEGAWRVLLFAHTTPYCRHSVCCCRQKERKESIFVLSRNKRPQKSAKDFTRSRKIAQGEGWMRTDHVNAIYISPPSPSHLMNVDFLIVFR
jgi:hypothetical protein